MVKAKKYLDCSKSTKKYNVMVDKMGKLGVDFNIIVKQYKVLQKNK